MEESRSCVLFCLFAFIFFIFTNSRPGVKRGKENNMENQNMESQTMTQEGQQQGIGEGAQGAQQTQQQEKTFTQEEVNRIVQERLARAKNAPDNSGYAEREQALDQRERRLEAREKLADAGIPKELLPLVNCSSKKDMEDSIKLISTYFHGSNKPGSGYRISTGAASGAGAGYSSGHTKGAADDEIRAAMGLKGR